jgi:glycosyltransferase involved in cell wall biosynthesis
MIPALRRCDRLLVHSIDDLNRLKALGLVDNVTLFPHGVITLDSPAIIKKGRSRRRTIGTYGFALPHKGLTETVQAIALLRRRGLDIDLRMTNAEYPAPISTKYVADLRSLIAELELDAVVDFCSDFLSDEEAAARMRETDLIVFPYQNTEESASGAVRYGMAMQKPVMVSPNPIFKDLSGATFLCASATGEGVADGIVQALHEIQTKSAKATEIASRAANWREEHAYQNLAGRLTGMCLSLANQH